ncbi:MAG: hypothetical protein DYG89_39355 [Caldilinea sp. CFX5]|nr:hypothetical protein [Caldilinea sp. CFX5]
MKAIVSYKFIALVLCIAILSYGVRQSQGTAEAAVVKQYPAAAQFEFLGYHLAPFWQGQFLLYRWQASGELLPEYGYISVKRNLWGQWRVGTGGKCSSSDTAQLASLADFSAHYLWYTYGYNEMVSYSVVCGRTSSAQVQTVAILWADGEVTAEPVAQGWFMILRPERQAACQLQLLDQQRTVIHTIDLAQFDFTTADSTTPLPGCVQKTKG